MFLACTRNVCDAGIGDSVNFLVVSNVKFCGCHLTVLTTQYKCESFFFDVGHIISIINVGSHWFVIVFGL